MTDNIIVLDHFYTFTKKSHLIGRLKYDLTQFFDNLVVAYILGHSVVGLRHIPLPKWPILCWVGVKLYSLTHPLAPYKLLYDDDNNDDDDDDYNDADLGII